MADITSKDLKDRILKILENGRLFYSDHVKKRMVERNYEISDVLHILRHGHILKYTRKGVEKYRCEVHGDDLEGCKGVVITIVIENTRLIVVTVLGGV